MEAAQFARRLRGSKAVRLGFGNAPAEVLTSPTGWLQKDEYGLKQPLPSRRRPSPFIKLQRLDNEWARPDWTPSTTEALFVRKWDESGLTAPVKDRASAAEFVVGSHYDPGSVPDADGLAAIAAAAKGKQKGAPDFTWLSQEDFGHYLDKLRDLQPAFAEFCRNRQASDEGEPVASTSKLPSSDDELLVAARTERARGRLIVDFLNEHAEELTASLPAKSKHHSRQQELTPMPHPNLGLHYAPFSSMHNERFIEPIPGRVLSKRVASDFKNIPGQGGYLDASKIKELETETGKKHLWQTSFMGVVAGLDHRDVAGTGAVQWLPDDNGYRNEETGKGHFRVEDWVSSGDGAEAVVQTYRRPQPGQRHPQSLPEYTLERQMDMMGGHRAVSRESINREWLKDPGVPNRPVTLKLRSVNMVEESERDLPGSAKYVYGTGQSESILQQSAAFRAFDDADAGLFAESSYMPARHEGQARGLFKQGAAFPSLHTPAAGSRDYLEDRVDEHINQIQPEGDGDPSATLASAASAAEGDAAATAKPSDSNELQKLIDRLGQLEELKGKLKATQRPKDE